MVTSSGKKALIWGVLALLLWAVYLAVSAAPVGAPFVYAEF